jgi:hypothetical protein
VVDEATFVLPLEAVIDIAAERARLARRSRSAEKDRDGLAGGLASPAFVERAKPEAVAKAREDHRARPRRPSGCRRRWRGWDRFSLGRRRHPSAGWNFGGAWREGGPFRGRSQPALG